MPFEFSRSAKQGLALSFSDVLSVLCYETDVADRRSSALPSSAVVSSQSSGVRFKAVGMRSNLWPGAVSVALGVDFCNVYVGWGLKNAPFVPVPPPPVAFEFDQKLLESTELPPRVVPEEGEGEEEE